MNEVSIFIKWAHNMPTPTLEWFTELYGAHMGKHFFDKWAGALPRFQTTTECMLMFFFNEMSASYQDSLVNWVVDTYYETHNG